MADYSSGFFFVETFKIKKDTTQNEKEKEKSRKVILVKPFSFAVTPVRPMDVEEIRARFLIKSRAVLRTKSSAKTVFLITISSSSSLSLSSEFLPLIYSFNIPYTVPSLLLCNRTRKTVFTFSLIFV